MPARSADPRAPIRFGLTLAAALAVGLAASSASGYCRTAVCSGTSGQRCVPAQSADCGTPLRWTQGCLGFSVNARGSKHADLATAESLMETAFTSWQNATCTGGRPSFRVFNLCPVTCDKKQYNQQGGNANIVVFRDGAWPYMGAGNTLALTTVTYNLDDGSIFDADLEINGTVNLTTGDSGVQFDLLSIVTHEVGHILGLAHSADKEATMFIQYVPGDLSLRTLSPDDMAGICAAYPPGVPTAQCDPTPRRGFASVCDGPTSTEKNACGDQPAKSGCSCSAVPGAQSALGGLVALAAATAMRMRRRTAAR